MLCCHERADRHPRLKAISNKRKGCVDRSLCLIRNTFIKKKSGRDGTITVAGAVGTDSSRCCQLDLSYQLHLNRCLGAGQLGHGLRQYEDAVVVRQPAVLERLERVPHNIARIRIDWADVKPI